MTAKAAWTAMVMIFPMVVMTAMAIDEGLVAMTAMAVVAAMGNEKFRMAGVPAKSSDIPTSRMQGIGCRYDSC